VHCCGTALPWKALQRSNISAASVDAGTLDAADLDAIAEFVESGRAIVLGVVSSSTPPRRPAVEEVAAAVVAVTDRLGFTRSALRRSHRRHAGVRTGRRNPAVGSHGHRTGPAGG